MLRGVTEMVQALFKLLPFEWAVAIAVLGLLMAIPLWYESMRARQLQSLTRRFMRARPPARPALADRMFQLANDKPSRLIHLVKQANKYGQHDLRAQALARLKATGGAPEQVDKFIQERARPPAVMRDPLEAVIKIEALIAQGLVVAAHEHLEQARRRFPNNPELQALAESLGS